MSQTTQSFQTARRFKAHPAWYLLGAVIVAAWLAVLTGMFAPFGDEGRLVELDSDALRAAPPLGRTWMGAYQNGRKLGWVENQVSRRQGGGLLLESKSLLSISVGGVGQKFNSHMRVELDDEQALESFRFQMEAGPLGARAKGRWTGSVLEIEAGLGERLATRRLTMDQAPVFDLTLPAVLVRQDLSAGQRYRVQLFDPQSLSQGTAVIEVVGPEALNLGGLMKPVMHFRRSVGGVQVESWIDAQGRLLKERVDGGFELRMEDEDQAKRDLDDKGLDPAALPGLGSLLGKDKP